MVPFANPSKFPPTSMKQLGPRRRLKGMNATFRPIALAAIRSGLMVGAAFLLVMVLLPAALAVHAATS